ncbi:MAG: cation:proton antiporter, partial [Candidatus Aenigmarchaeota archaeon]|nr:cation:proton antiporter [Candidatus Aenigmarchaeota archaeon]
MGELFVLVSLTYLFSITFGRLLEKFKIPWIFSALFLGIIISSLHIPFFENVITSKEFDFLANLGLLFMLFIVGFELEIKQLKSLSKFILFTTLFIVLFDVSTGTLLLSCFGYPLMVSLICAFSFATVGEVVLVPILDEFKLMKSKMGATIIGVGTFDDVIEVFTIFLAATLIGTSVKGFNPYFSTVSTLSLLFLFFGFLKFKKEIKRSWRISPKIEDFFLFSLFILFAFISVGFFGSLEMLGALLAGIGVRNFLPKNVLEGVENAIRLIGYGLFGILFFLWVGIHTN